MELRPLAPRPNPVLSWPSSASSLSTSSISRSPLSPIVTTNIPSGQPPPIFDPRLSLRLLSTSTLRSFQRLNSTLLPIRYPESFYNAFLQPDSNTLCFAFVAIWDDNFSTPPLASGRGSNDRQPKPQEKGRVVGGISCRLEPLDISKDDATTAVAAHPPYGLYISTLATLSPYRGHGIGSSLISLAITHALSLVSQLNLSLQRVYAHVWEANPEAAEWYRRREFDVGEVQGGYYRRLKPDGARIVKKAIVGAAVRSMIEDGGGFGKLGS